LTGASGAVVARYQYNPYGKLLASSSALAAANNIRFSSKYTDTETGLLYYGYRFYSPELGRWLNRDPIGELGGINLYMFVRNSAINYVDRLGLIDLGSIISGAQEMKDKVSTEMAQEAGKVCAQGVGSHPLKASGHVTFTGPILGALLNISSWSKTGTGTVSSDSTCKTCRKYSLQATWNFSDSIDCNSFEELKSKGYFAPGNPWWGDLLGYLEGACEKVGLNIFAVPVSASWQEAKSGCCDK
ncbi:MAG: RHS repeat-associated core domain-containing protein, partial [Candidatus Eisenbacteria bacterium]|nr:RHS repeat-associated core domain-containing protein [Candidatus Eisenbacteria bacterium]